MEIGRIYNFNNPHLTAEEVAAAAAKVKAMGLDFIESCCNSRAEAERYVANLPALKEGLRRANMRLSCVGRWNHDVQSGGKINDSAAASYYALMDAAAEAGAKTFVVGCNYDDTVSLFRNYSNAIEFFGRLLEHANGRIKVAVQNCRWNNFVVSPAEWEAVLGELKELGIKFDASHAYNYGRDYLAELSDWGERVYHVHIKGATHAGKRAVDDPPAGMDDIRWSSLFAVLYSRGYDGDLSLEPHSAAWNGARGDAGIKFTVDFIRKFIV